MVFPGTLPVLVPGPGLARSRFDCVCMHVVRVLPPPFLTLLVVVVCSFLLFLPVLQDYREVRLRAWLKPGR